VPIADTLGALGELVQAGHVREIGCSNFSAAQLDEAEAAVAAGAPRFVSVQNEYSLLHREPEAEVLPACERLGVAFLPYFPLMSGLLTGKYRKGRRCPRAPASSAASASGAAAHRRSLDLSRRWSRTPSRAASRAPRPGLRLAARAPQVASVIAGATSPSRCGATPPPPVDDERRGARRVERILAEHPATPRA
jgi:aryl-alcohol dehydrogenase-like predicted oxidoreductase